MPSSSPTSPTSPTRRTVLRTGAWAVPAVSLAGAAPAFAVSPGTTPPPLALTQSGWSASNSALYGNYVGWRNTTPGDGLQNSNSPTMPWGTGITSGFVSGSQYTGTTTRTVTATWTMNVTSPGAYTVRANLEAPFVSGASFLGRQRVTLTASAFGISPVPVVGAYHGVGTGTITANPVDLPAVFLTYTQLTGTFSATVTGTWTLQATFEYFAAGAMTRQPFILETPVVTKNS